MVRILAPAVLCVSDAASNLGKTGEPLAAEPRATLERQTCAVRPEFPMLCIARYSIIKASNAVPVTEPLVREKAGHDRKDLDLMKLAASQ